MNNVIRKDTYSLPRVDGTLNALRGSRYVISLADYSGYCQVKMDPAYIDKTFIPRLYVFTVMHFGLCHASRRFEQRRDQNWKVFLIYIDDTIVCGLDFYESLHWLRLVWSRSDRRTWNWNRPNTCTMYSMRASGPFLKEAVDHWPRTVKDVSLRAFLLLASYYRRYTPGVATVSAPLNNLTCHRVEGI